MIGVLIVIFAVVFSFISPYSCIRLNESLGFSRQHCPALSPWQGDEHEVRRGYKRGRGTSGTKRSGGGVELYSSFMHPLRFVSLHSSPCQGDSAGSDAEYILSFRVYRTTIITKKDCL